MTVFLSWDLLLSYTLWILPQKAFSLLSRRRYLLEACNSDQVWVWFFRLKNSLWAIGTGGVVPRKDTSHPLGILWVASFSLRCMCLINSHTLFHWSVVWVHWVNRVLLVIRVCIYPIHIVSNRNTARVLTEHIVRQSVNVWTILLAWLVYIARCNLLIHIIVVSSLWEWTLIFHPIFLCTKFCVALLFLFNWCISLVINVF